MPLSWKARRRWSLVLLLVWLPAYVVVAVTFMNWIGRPPVAVEAILYLVLGVAWALPFRAVFRGVGKEDPDRPGGACRGRTRKGRGDVLPARHSLPTATQRQSAALRCSGLYREDFEIVNWPRLTLRILP